MQVSSNAEVKPNNWGGVVELWSGDWWGDWIGGVIGVVGLWIGAWTPRPRVCFLPVRRAVPPRELRKLHQLGGLGSERPQSDRAIPAESAQKPQNDPFR